MCTSARACSVLCVTPPERRGARLDGGRTGCNTARMAAAPESSPDIRLTAEQVEAITHAIGDPRRFAMLREIAGLPVLACSGLSVKGCLKAPTISHHLKELQGAGLIEVERQGREVRMTMRRDVWAAYVRELASL